MAKNNNKIEQFEKTLFKAADMLRKNMDAAEYKHIVLCMASAHDLPSLTKRRDGVCSGQWLSFISNKQRG
jgi:hypothetical protein